MKKKKPFWLSFVKNHINAGCCIIDAFSETGALKRATKLGINPGGEVAIFELPPDAEDITRWGKDILIPREKLVSEGYRRVGGDRSTGTVPLPEGAEVVCEDCNKQVQHEH